jgi:flagellar biosynthesis protein FliP
MYSVRTPKRLSRSLKPPKVICWLVIFTLFTVNISTLFAQAAPSGGVQLNISLGDLGAPREISTGLQLLLLFTALTLAPSIVIMTTSFTRIVVVLSFLRTALGIQQPSGQIVVGLALFLTAFIMFPVWQQIHKEAIIPMQEKKLDASQVMERVSVPIKNFMLRYTREKDIDLFLSMAPVPADGGSDLRKDPPLQVVIPAFMVSELRTAFQMGFVIYLPFLVIDIVVASILMAMGMMMLPPAMVTLPLKILVFVLADGWGLIVRQLVMSFQT